MENADSLREPRSRALGPRVCGWRIRNIFAPPRGLHRYLCNHVRNVVLRGKGEGLLLSAPHLRPQALDQGAYSEALCAPAQSNRILTHRVLYATYLQMKVEICSFSNKKIYPCVRRETTGRSPSGATASCSSVVTARCVLTKCRFGVYRGCDDAQTQTKNDVQTRSRTTMCTRELDRAIHWGCTTHSHEWFLPRHCTRLYSLSHAGLNVFERFVEQGCTK